MVTIQAMSADTTSMLRESYCLPSPDDAIELRAFTHGLMPKRVPAMMQQFVSDWQQYGVDAWNEVPNHWRPDSGDRVGWWTLPTYLGDQFIAPLLGAPSSSCVMQPNAHWVVQCLLSSKEVFAKKRKVILTEAEFPSVRFSIHQWSNLLNLNVEILPLINDSIDEQAVLDAIDDNTALVILSHVGFTTGERLRDAFIQAVAAKANACEALLALDGYHSIGTMEASVSALNVDVYFGGLLKEGSGSSGNAFVYVRPGLQLTPRLTGWFGDAAPFEFNATPEAHPEVRQRFLGGTTAVVSLYHAVEGIRLLLHAGLDKVRLDSLEKTQRCIDRALESGLHLRSPQEAARRSAMVIFEMERADLMVAYLKKHHVYADSRQGRFLRIAPFVWNTIREIDNTFDIISTGIKNQKYLTVQQENAIGPVT